MRETERDREGGREKRQREGGREGGTKRGGRREKREVTLKEKTFCGFLFVLSANKTKQIVDQRKLRSKKLTSSNKESSKKLTSLKETNKFENANM